MNTTKRLIVTILVFVMTLSIGGAALAYPDSFAAPLGPQDSQTESVKTNDPSGTSAGASVDTSAGTSDDENGTSGSTEKNETKETAEPKSTTGTEKDAKGSAEPEKTTGTEKSSTSEKAAEPEKTGKPARSEETAEPEKKTETKKTTEIEKKTEPEKTKDSSFDSVTLEKKIKASNGRYYRVSATYGSETGIPENAVLSVDEVSPDDKDFKALEKKSDRALEAYEKNNGDDENGDHSGMLKLGNDQSLILDIKITDRVGNEYQPEKGTSVEVSVLMIPTKKEKKEYEEAYGDYFDGKKGADDKNGKSSRDEEISADGLFRMDDQDLPVVHIKDNGKTEVLESDTEPAAEGVRFTFETESFSYFRLRFNLEYMDVYGIISNQAGTGKYENLLIGANGEIIMGDISILPFNEYVQSTDVASSFLSVNSSSNRYKYILTSHVDNDWRDNNKTVPSAKLVTGLNNNTVSLPKLNNELVDIPRLYTPIGGGLLTNWHGYENGITSRYVKLSGGTYITGYGDLAVMLFEERLTYFTIANYSSEDIDINGITLSGNNRVNRYSDAGFVLEGVTAPTLDQLNSLVPLPALQKLSAYSTTLAAGDANTVVVPTAHGDGYTVQYETENNPALAYTQSGFVNGQSRRETHNAVGKTSISSGSYVLTNDKTQMLIFEEAIARVSNDNGTTWTYHPYLINSGEKTGEPGVKKGAFDQAKTLTGNVIIETLRKGYDAESGKDDTKVGDETTGRYTLQAGTTFNNNADLTLQTTQDNEWNPDKFESLLKRGYDTGESMLKLDNASASLTVKNIILDGGREDGLRCEGVGGVINVNAGKTLTIQKATIRNSESTENGGGVYAEKTVSSTVNDGTFTNCVVKKKEDATGNGGYSGGGAYFYGPANAYCVTVTDCHADDDKGGGLYFFNPDSTLGTSYGTVTKKSVISNCSAKEGGGVYFKDTGGKIQGAENARVEITGCTAGENGGGAYINKSCTLTNVTIDGNGSAAALKDNAKTGGGIYFNASAATYQLILEGETVIRDCRAKNSGGGIYQKQGVLELKDTTLITGCVASTNLGGGIYDESGTVNTRSLTHSENTGVQNCTAQKGGGIAAIEGNAVVNIEKGHYSGNKATNIGGGMLRLEKGAKAYIRGGEIHNNSVETGGQAFGGAINVKKGEVYIYDGAKIYANTVQGKNTLAMGGAIHLSGQTSTGDSAKLYLYGGEITNNELKNTTTVDAYGGGISLLGPNAELIMSGGTISGNSVNTSKTAYGGAVSLYTGGKMTLTGGTISGNGVNGAGGSIGAGIYIDAASMLMIQGGPSFSNNMVGSYHQDIYITQAPKTMLVTGDMAAASSPIYVWVENDDHYKQKKSFAYFETETVPANLNVFKNPRPNSDTGNTTGELLYGTDQGTPPSGDTTRYVYWNGPEGARKVVLRKVMVYSDDADYRSMTGGARFTLYKVGDLVNPVVVDDRVVADRTPGSNGLYFIGELPYGDYLIKEDKASGTRWFWMIVHAKGVFVDFTRYDNVSYPDGFETSDAAEMTMTYAKTQLGIN